MEVLADIIFMLLIAALITLWVYGAILALKASVLLLIVSFIIFAPSFTIYGLLAVFGYPEVCNRIVEAVGKLLR